MPHPVMIDKVPLSIIILLAVNLLTFAQANPNGNTTQRVSNLNSLEGDGSMPANNQNFSETTISHEWPPLAENSESPKSQQEKPTPELDDLVNRMLECINQSSPNGQENPTNDNSHLKTFERDSLNQSVPAEDGLVYDEHHDGPDRHIQYDTMQLTNDNPSTSKYELNEESNQKMSRYMVGNDSIANSLDQPDANNNSVQEKQHQHHNIAVHGRAIAGLMRAISHHSAPYATRDLYTNHQSSGELPLINMRKSSTMSMAEVIPAEGNDIASKEQMVFNQQSQKPNSTTQGTNVEIMNSIKRISNHLVNDDGKDTLTGVKQSLTAENLLEKQEFQKLAPANSPVELDPIPLDEPSDQAPSRKEEKMRLSSLFPGWSPSSSESAPLQYNPDTDLPLYSDTSNTNRIMMQESLSMRDDESARLTGNHLTKKTMETVSNQLKQQQQQHHEVWDNQGSSNRHSPVGNIIHRAGPMTHYAASLTNVTAPLIPPHSATEAMETSLGGQAGRELLNQVSGFLSQVNLTNSPDERQQQRVPHAAQQWYPAANASANSQSIYLPPANSFASLKPPAARPAAFDSLSSSMSQNEPVISTTTTTTTNSSTDRRLDNFHYNRRPISPAGQQQQPVLPSQPASGFRSPISTGIGNDQAPSSGTFWSSKGTPYPSSYLNMPPTVASGQESASLAAGMSLNSPTSSSHSSQNTNSTSLSTQAQQHLSSSSLSSIPATTASISSLATTNGFLTGGTVATSGEQTSITQQHQHMTSTTTPGSILTTPSSAGSTIAFATASTSAFGQSVTESTPANASQAVGLNRRVFNLTRVEHISAECSNDLIRTIIVFNGTFRGMIYSSGYVRDSSCIYVNGTGKTRYDFSIRLNQCGTSSRQELHPAGKDNDVRRRDQVMLNTLSIQYNPIIEQEWDEHFRVSCEYGSDFWKTVSFNPFNVETNTGAPVVFTVDPPQCQMEILRGHGMVGPRQETISGPVTVGDPLTLLIHMKSERAGYDILVKNCVAHDNVKQRMQLIDSNGCVVNERFISPFRGTYNDNDLKHVTLYAYLKAFRFTGSPILYLECEIHMCQSSCPPQMCYWRRLSKRSTSPSNGTLKTMQISADDDLDEEEVHAASPTNNNQRGGTRKGRRMGDPERGDKQSYNLSDKMSLTQSLLVKPLDDPDAEAYPLQRQQSYYDQMDGGQLLCYKRAGVLAFLLATGSLLVVAMSVTVACCWQQTIKLKHLRRSNLAEVAKMGLCGASPSLTSLSSANSTSSTSTTYFPTVNPQLANVCQVQTVGHRFGLRSPDWHTLRGSTH